MGFGTDTANNKFVISAGNRASTAMITATGLEIVRASGADVAVYFNHGDQQFIIGVDNSDQFFHISEGNALGTNDRWVIDSAGNILIGTATAPTGTATATLVLADNVSFPTLSANQAALYNKSGEMFAIDEDENEAQLTGNTEDYPSDMVVSVNYPYVNPVTQHYVGITTYTARNKESELVQQLARAAGLLDNDEYIIRHTTFNPQINWETNQEAQRLKREQERQDAQDRISKLDIQIAAKIVEIGLETDLEKKLALIKKRNILQSNKENIIVPSSYVKRNPDSQWLISKGIKLKP